MNTARTVQTVEVEVFGAAVTRTLALPPRSRQAWELGDWGVRGDCGVEVRCVGCVASLVLWDRAYERAYAALPLTGCDVP